MVSVRITRLSWAFTVIPLMPSSIATQALMMSIVDNNESVRESVELLIHYEGRRAAFAAAYCADGSAKEKMLPTPTVPLV